MNLSIEHINKIPAAGGLILPGRQVFELPEKVLQFGTGVLLRGLPDFIINKANNKGIFNGRIVMVKSTANGSADAFANQDALYTVCVRGVAEQEKISENHVIASVSRVLSAATEWNSILECAANPDMQVIISNTTEVGIALIKDNIHADPPQSFPGKLLSFLYHRYKFFKGDPEKGMVVIPTELIPSNGDKLLSIVLELAHINSLESTFLDWLENANYFCNSLVDRIVPGKLNTGAQQQLEKSLGYSDELLIISEVYNLWAIQSGSEKVKQVLSFATPDSGVVIAPDIEKYRELKIRLLNAPHTFSCGLAFLSGFDTVKNAMDDKLISGYIKGLMFDEIIPVITGDIISNSEAGDFASQVLDRYRNSFIEHSWLSITLQYSSKMYLRNVPLIEKYVACFGHPPLLMSIGMAGHILFMRVEKNEEGYRGSIKGISYPVNDDNVKFYEKAWKGQQVVHEILSNEDIWGMNLSTLPGFEESVSYWLQLMMEKGVPYALQEAGRQKTAMIHEK